MDEAELGRRAAAGDAAAFAALARMHEGKVRRFLSRLVRGDGADDIAQEVFVRAWRRRAAWRQEGSYGAWLMRIAWTSFLAARRARSRQQARDRRAWEEAEAVAPPPPDLRIDVAAALAELGERERAAAQLCFAEGYSHTEAAAIMDLPLGTLKSILARARAHLATLLEARHDG